MTCNKTIGRCQRWRWSIWRSFWRGLLNIFPQFFLSSAVTPPFGKKIFIPAPSPSMCLENIQCYQLWKTRSLQHCIKNSYNLDFYYRPDFSTFLLQQTKCPMRNSMRLSSVVTITGMRNVLQSELTVVQKYYEVIDIKILSNSTKLYQNTLQV